jgi:hypothetical protein
MAQTFTPCATLAPAPEEKEIVRHWKIADWLAKPNPDEVMFQIFAALSSGGKPAAKDHAIDKIAAITDVTVSRFNADLPKRERQRHQHQRQHHGQRNAPGLQSTWFPDCRQRLSPLPPIDQLSH